MTAFSRLYDPNVFLDLLTNQEGFCEHYRTPFGVEWLIDYFRRGGLMGPGSPVLYPQAPYYREPDRHGEVVDALHKAESGRLADGLVSMDRLWNEYKMIKAALIVPDEEPLELLDIYDLDENKHPMLKYPRSPLLDHLPYVRVEQPGRTRTTARGTSASSSARPAQAANVAGETASRRKSDEAYARRLQEAEYAAEED
jgi:hypothetical protein